MVLPPKGLAALGPWSCLAHSVYTSDQKGIRDRRCALDVPAGYLHLGFIVISVPNLGLIAAMIVIFAIALLAPFPRGRRESGGDGT
jgi:hypothetical protein